MNHQEYDLQKAICLYLSVQYPKALFISDTIASLKLTKMQAIRNKAIQKKDFKCPDVIILEPRGNYAGLLIELKIESPFKKNGSIKSNEHLQGQLKSINSLNEKGFKSCFSWGFDMTKKIIDDYFNLPAIEIKVPESFTIQNFALNPK